MSLSDAKMRWCESCGRDASELGSIDLEVGGNTCLSCGTFNCADCPDLLYLLVKSAQWPTESELKGSLHFTGFKMPKSSSRSWSGQTQCC